jgi:hypothetical protein
MIIYSRESSVKCVNFRRMEFMCKRRTPELGCGGARIMGYET